LSRSSINNSLYFMEAALEPGKKTFAFDFSISY